MSDFSEYSYDEFMRGGVAATLSTVLFGWAIGIGTIITCGLLWMFGGTYSKPIRRYGVPLVLFGAAVVLLGWNWIYLIGLFVGSATLHLGDGFPDRRVKTYDEGSWLGRQVEKVFPQDDIGGPVTKWVIVALFQLSLIPYFIK